MALDMQSIYILASGSSRAMEQLDTITNNLANVNTAGFKKMVIKEMSQRLVDNGGDANHLFVFPRFSESLLEMTQGPLKETNEPLDFAIDGNGYFKVETKDGAMYTRSGHFLLDPQGYIVDKNGNFLLDSEDRRIKLDLKSPVSVTEDGTIYQNSKKIATLAIEDFQRLKPVGDTYYLPAGAAKEPRYKIHQGFLERSNINPITEMTDMITAHRRFEIYNNLIKAIDQINQKTNEIGKA